MELVGTALPYVLAFVAKEIPQWKASPLVYFVTNHQIRTGFVAFFGTAILYLIFWAPYAICKELQKKRDDAIKERDELQIKLNERQLSPLEQRNLAVDLAREGRAIYGLLNLSAGKEGVDFATAWISEAKTFGKKLSLRAYDLVCQYSKDFHSDFNDALIQQNPDLLWVGLSSEVAKIIPALDKIAEEITRFGRFD